MGGSRRGETLLGLRWRGEAAEAALCQNIEMSVVLGDGDGAGAGRDGREDVVPVAAHR